MRKLISNEVYSDIINIIGKWKIIDYKGLSSELQSKFSRQGLSRRVVYLEKCGLVKSTTFDHKRKYIYLSEEGIKLTRHDNTYEPMEETILHDLLVGTVVREFLKFERIIDAKMYHKLSYDLLHPDAVIVGHKDAKTYNIAIELELTQKSKKRILDKYSSYGSSSLYDYVIYVSNKEKLIDTYIRFLGEMNPLIQKKLFFILNPNLTPKGIHFDKDTVMHQGSEQIEFCKFFGKKQSEQ